MSLLDTDLSQAKHKIRHQQPITWVDIEFILFINDIFSVTDIYGLLSQLRELYFNYYKCICALMIKLLFMREVPKAGF